MEACCSECYCCELNLSFLLIKPSKPKSSFKVASSEQLFLKRPLGDHSRAKTSSKPSDPYPIVLDSLSSLHYHLSPLPSTKHSPSEHYLSKHCIPSILLQATLPILDSCIGCKQDLLPRIHSVSHFGTHVRFYQMLSAFTKHVHLTLYKITLTNSIRTPKKSASWPQHFTLKSNPECKQTP
jgi:hypothetical protein